MRKTMRETGSCFIFSFIIVITLLSGCATIGPPVGVEREAVLQKKQSIVLMKINTVLCGKDRSFSLLPIQYASIDRGENVKDIAFLSSPSSEGRQRGWIYLMLEPGSYFFTANFKNYNLFTIVPHDARMPGASFMLHVPEDKPLVYAGSLSHLCACKPGFFADTITDCLPMEVRDDSNEARENARPLTDQYGPLFTSLIKPFPAMSGPFGLDEALLLPPMGIVTKNTRILDTPNWMERGIARGIAPGYYFFLGGPYGVFPFLAYAPIGIAFGSLGGGHSHNKWQPCMERLAGELNMIDPATEIRTAFTSQFAETGCAPVQYIPSETGFLETARERGLKTVLHSYIDTISFKECSERWTFCVEIKIRVRLFDAMTGDILRDSAFIYTNDKKTAQPYMLPLSLTSQCRKIEEYCQAGSEHIVKEELLKAISETAQETVRRWNLVTGVN
jgi:hypothetical protein